MPLEPVCACSTLTITDTTLYSTRLLLTYSSRFFGSYAKGEAGKFGNTDAEYEAIVLDLLAAVGAQDLMPRVKRLEDVFCAPNFPQKCFSVSRELVMSMPDCRAYVEGVMFSEGFLYPIGHAMVRDGHGRLRDLSQKEVGSVYFCVEFEASEFRAAMADPLFVAEYERYTEFPYMRALLAFGRSL